LLKKWGFYSGYSIIIITWSLTNLSLNYYLGDV